MVDDRVYLGDSYRYGDATVFLIFVSRLLGSDELLSRVSCLSGARDTREARVQRRGRARSGGGVRQCAAHTGAHGGGHLAAGGGTAAEDRRPGRAVGGRLAWRPSSAVTFLALSLIFFFATFIDTATVFVFFSIN